MYKEEEMLIPINNLNRFLALVILNEMRFINKNYLIFLN
jgi:hypothetical protein